MKTDTNTTDDIVRLTDAEIVAVSGAGRGSVVIAGGSNRR
jgi:hypothetical protein